MIDFPLQHEWESYAEYARRAAAYIRKGNLYDKTDPEKRNLVAGGKLASQPKAETRDDASHNGRRK